MPFTARLHLLLAPVTVCVELVPVLVLLRVLFTELIYILLNVLDPVSNRSFLSKLLFSSLSLLRLLGRFFHPQVAHRFRQVFVEPGQAHWHCLSHLKDGIGFLPSHLMIPASPGPHSFCHIV